MLIRCHLKPALGSITLRDLRPEHLKAFYNEKAKEYRGEQRASMRKLDVRSVRRWKSGNLTVSLTRDASDQRTLQAWK